MYMYMYMNGLCVVTDFRYAFDWLRPSAENGNIATENVLNEWGYSDPDAEKLSKLCGLLLQHSENLPGHAYFVDVLIAAIKQLKTDKVFGEHTEDITYFVSISDVEAAELIEDYSATQLAGDGRHIPKPQKVTIYRFGSVYISIYRTKPNLFFAQAIDASHKKL